MNVLKMGFVCLNAYPLFNPTVDWVFGGSEVRAWTLARALAKRPGCSVCFVVFDHGQKREERIDEVLVRPHPYYRVVPETARPSSPSQGASVPFPARCLLMLRSRAREARRRASSILSRLNPLGVQLLGEPVASKAYAIYDEIGVDVLCTLGVSDFSAEVVAYCKARRMPVVLILGSDSDLSLEYRTDSRQVNSYGSRADRCHFALSQADVIITQTRWQAAACRTRFGRRAATVGNPIDAPESGAPVPTATADRRFALWIGKSDTVKQPEVLLEMARARPAIPFLMVLNRSDSRVHQQVLRQRPGNVEIIESIPFSSSDTLFQRSFVLVNTSRFEGFPNTFLQAGRCGLPVLSLNVDPDGLVQEQRCGVVAHGSMQRLIEGLDHLIEGDRWLEAGRRLRAYVLEHHRASEKVSEFEAELRKALAGGRS